MESLRSEAVELLRALVRLDTVNPPGNETRAAELLRGYLEGSGVQCELLARTPERANLVARLPGSGDGPTLALLSHTDTVLADPADWSRDPWSGDLFDGEVWGRGALDMKGQAAASAVALASLAREGFRPRGDLVFVAAADEEVGEDYGLSWLCQEHPDAVRADFSLNEGGGDRLVLDGRTFYTCASAEKMSSPFLLRVRGHSGHASMPGVGDNALVRAAALVERLAALRPRPTVGPEVAGFLTALTGEANVYPDEAVERAAAVHPQAGTLVEPLLSLTVSPTMIRASEKRNVIPAVCEVTCDCRLLPGQTPREAEATLREALGDGDYELEWLERWGGTRSPLRTPLWAAVESFVIRLEPGAELVPMCLAGFTDSHWLREAFGTVAYGFFPLRAMDSEQASRLIHAPDERIAVEDLELGVDFLRHVARVIGRG